ncbi:hypothetical protein LRC484719_01640 [Mycobacterium riyadhense]
MPVVAGEQHDEPARRAEHSERTDAARTERIHMNHNAFARTNRAKLSRDADRWLFHTHLPMSLPLPKNGTPNHSCAEPK